MKRYDRNFCSKARKRDSGAALVETAVMFLVIVPLAFYVFSMSDMAFQILDAQEAVISTIWDFSTAPYGHIPSGYNFLGTGQQEGIAHFNRIEYADHTSAQIALGTCGDAKWHNRPWIQMSWGVSSTTETDYSHYSDNVSTGVTCVRKGDMAITSSDGGDWAAGVKSYSSASDGKGGGRFVCWAKGELHNYLIPKQLYPEFTETEMISSRADKKIEEEQGFYGQRGSGWLVLKNRASLVAGTWATTDTDTLETQLKSDALKDMIPYTFGLLSVGKGDFYKRARDYYDAKEGATGFVAGVNALKQVAIGSYLTKLTSEKFTALGPATVPSPLHLWMAYTFSKTGKDFETSDYRYKPFGDGMGDELYTLSSEAYLDTAKEKRGVYYLGNKEIIGGTSSN